MCNLRHTRHYTQNFNTRHCIVRVLYERTSRVGKSGFAKTRLPWDAQHGTGWCIPKGRSSSLQGGWEDKGTACQGRTAFRQREGSLLPANTPSISPIIFRGRLLPMPVMAGYVQSQRLMRTSSCIHPISDPAHPAKTSLQLSQPCAWGHERYLNPPSAYSKEPHLQRVSGVLHNDRPNSNFIQILLPAL